MNRSNRVPQEIVERVASAAAQTILGMDRRLEFFVVVAGPGDGDAVAYNGMIRKEEVLNILTDNAWEEGERNV